MTQPRCVMPGATYLVTRRCLERRFLLLPRGKAREIFAFCFAVAVVRHGMLVHAATAMSNHYHAVVTDPRGGISAFLQCFHSLLARAMNAHYGRWDAFWSTQRPSVVRLVNPEDVLDKIVYTLVNPVAAGLVRSRVEWPGYRTAPESCTHPPVPWRRPDVFFRPDGPVAEECAFEVTPPPQFAHLSPAEFADLVASRVRAREEEIAQAQRERGTAPLGVARVLRQRRTDRPAEPRPRTRSLSPEVACKNREDRIAALASLATFRSEYRAARRAWRSGDRDVLFPPGTLQMVTQHGVRTGPPPGQAAAA